MEGGKSERGRVGAIVVGDGTAGGDASGETVPVDPGAAQVR